MLSVDTSPVGRVHAARTARAAWSRFVRVASLCCGWSRRRPFSSWAL